jgi:hypothetical protein
MKEINDSPRNLDEAIDTLLDFWGDNLVKSINENEERKFLAATHHGGGQFIRNSWYLWWFENHKYETWPKTKPAIVEFFNNIGITHADDMSSIILKSLHRKVRGREIDLDTEVKHYQNYWKKNGFPDDGIPKHK